MTILIFVFSRRAELKYKKHDDKKHQYLKLISLLEEIFMSYKKDKKGNLVITDNLKKRFFDVGASLLMYGSKKLYRQYLFYREFATNPLVLQSKYYEENLIMYIMADILVTMRKEVGLSVFNTLEANEALGFFVNDITGNPIAKEKAYKAKFRIRMIKFELGMINRTKFIFVKYIFYRVMKPIFACVSIILKYILIIPFGRLLIKIFPSLAEETRSQNNVSNK